MEVRSKPAAATDGHFVRPVHLEHVRRVAVSRVGNRDAHTPQRLEQRRALDPVGVVGADEQTLRQTAAQLQALLADAGIDVESLLAKGQLVILTAKEAYLKDAQFDPDKMITLLREETEKALAEGYPALGVTGEMTWALAGEPGSERLVEYESLLNHYFPKSECYAVCQYDRRRFDAEMLLDILHTHPKVMFGQEVPLVSGVNPVSVASFGTSE
jgi:hypothetical protein